MGDAAALQVPSPHPDDSDDWSDISETENKRRTARARRRRQQEHNPRRSVQKPTAPTSPETSKPPQLEFGRCTDRPRLTSPRSLITLALHKHNDHASSDRPQIRQATSATGSMTPRDDSTAQRDSFSGAGRTTHHDGICALSSCPISNIAGKVLTKWEVHDSVIEHEQGRGLAKEILFEKHSSRTQKVTYNRHQALKQVPYDLYPRVW